MDALFVLLIFSVLLGGGFLLAFFWAQKNGQFEDHETPAIRMLFDEKPPENNEIHPHKKSEKLTVSSEGARNGR
ncbi:MAG: cbb3-type cytochrome oxidase assembly protein CcoS [Spirochaetes bacterium]|nr:cbb3-type cytochrome oxidase assembly protein CcoS [Spirochaetota bacterium]